MIHHTPEHRRAATVRRLARARTIALTGVVIVPISLNAQNIVTWASSAEGLGLTTFWAVLAFCGLDLIAAVCVFEVLIQTSKGRKAGAFAALVWLFAGASAYAGYRHGQQPGVGKDVWWFFPLMALAGPLLLHLIITRSRKDVQVQEERRLQFAPASAYGWGRWIPGVGAFGETYCAWRVGRLEGGTLPAANVERYRVLRPDAGRWFGLRVVHAMRVEANRARVVDVKPVLEAAAPEPERPSNVRAITSGRRRGEPHPVYLLASEEPHLTPKQIAERLGVSTRTVTRRRPKTDRTNRTA